MLEDKRMSLNILEFLQKIWMGFGEWNSQNKVSIFKKLFYILLCDFILSVDSAALVKSRNKT